MFDASFNHHNTAATAGGGGCMATTRAFFRRYCLGIVGEMMDELKRPLYNEEEEEDGDSGDGGGSGGGGVGEGRTFTTPGVSSGGKPRWRPRRAGRDLYPQLFLVQFIALVYVGLNYSSLRRHRDTEYRSLTLNMVFSSNQVSTELLMVFLALFGHLMAERMIYLWRSPVSKLVMHYVAVIFLHGIIFFYYGTLQEAPVQSPAAPGPGKAPGAAAGAMSGGGGGGGGSGGGGAGGASMGGGGEEVAAGVIVGGTTYYLNGWLILYYLINLLYFQYSGMQVRVGYIPQGLGSPNYFFTSFSYTAYFRYIIYRAIPFVFEVKTILDWSCQQTALMMYDYIKFEDMVHTAYACKVDVEYRRWWKRDKGDPYPGPWKLLSGGCSLFGLLVVLVGPLGLFTTAPELSIGQGIASMSVSLDVVPGQQSHDHRFTLFATHERQQMVPSLAGHVVPSCDGQRGWLKTNFSNSIPGNFDLASLTYTSVVPQSSDVWAISPPMKMRLVNYLLPRFNTSTNIKLSYTLTRGGDTPPGSSGATTAASDQVTGFSNVTLTATQVVKLISIMNGSTAPGKDSVLKLRGLAPTVLHIPARGSTCTDDQCRATSSASLMRSDCDLAYVKEKFKDETDIVVLRWWELRCASPIETSCIPPDPVCMQGDGTVCTRADDSTGVHFVVAADPVLWADLGLFRTLFYSLSLTAIYITFIYAFGKFLRTFMVGMARRTIYENWPDVDYVWEMCMFVYVARSFKENKLEENLYIELLELFRSPEGIVKVTKCDDDDDHNFHQQCSLAKYKVE